MFPEIVTPIIMDFRTLLTVSRSEATLAKSDDTRRSSQEGSVSIQSLPSSIITSQTPKPLCLSDLIPQETSIPDMDRKKTLSLNELISPSVDTFSAKEFEEKTRHTLCLTEALGLKRETRVLSLLDQLENSVLTPPTNACPLNLESELFGGEEPSISELLSSLSAEGVDVKTLVSSLVDILTTSMNGVN